MSFNKCGAMVCIFLLAALAIAKSGTNNAAVSLSAEPALQNSEETEFISVEELKAKLSKNEPVAIVDVRAPNGLPANPEKIRGAVYVKLRRLKYRLGFPPLKDVPHNRLVVTYCACPNDESAVSAAQILREAGFKQVRVLRGGWVRWQKAKGQVERMAR